MKALQTRKAEASSTTDINAVNMSIDQYICQSGNPDTRADGFELISPFSDDDAYPNWNFNCRNCLLQKVGYICAELRKPVEDTVYRKVLSKRAIGDVGYVYFAEMHLPPGLSTDPSLTFIKIGKSGNAGVRLIVNFKQQILLSWRWETLFQSPI